MKIQKIFSNVENKTEKLYSVLMSEGEYNLFSKHKKDQEDNFRKELNDAYKKNNRGRNIGHAVLGGSLGMIAGALKKGGNPKSMLIGTAIGSGLGSLSEYGYRKATKQDKKYQKEVDKRVSDYHEKLKNISDQPNWDDYKDNKKYTNAIKTREKKINEAEEVRNKSLNDIKRNISKNPGKYNILKNFSTAGREWAGFKGGMKGALKGAKWGAILAPGNLIAAGLGHPKTALGITAAGSLVGGGIGFKLGRDSGISEYKYKNDPKYKEKVDKEKEEEYLEDLKSSQKSDEFEAWDFNIKDWKDFSDSLGLPPEILKYIKFYESWRKNIKLWYSKALPGKDCDYWAAEFRSFFPIPIPAKIVKEWYETDKKYHSITFLTDNDAGDDGYVCYDLETKLYGWDIPNDTPSLKTLLQDHTKRMKEIHELSREQENLVNKFLRSI